MGGVRSSGRLWAPDVLALSFHKTDRCQLVVLGGNVARPAFRTGGWVHHFGRVEMSGRRLLYKRIGPRVVEFLNFSGRSYRLRPPKDLPEWATLADQFGKIRLSLSSILKQYEIAF